MPATTKLAELLEASDKSDFEVGAFLKIHPTQISLYKTGKRAIHDEHALRLATYFGVTVEDLRGESLAGRTNAASEGPELIAGDWIE